MVTVKRINTENRKRRTYGRDVIIACDFNSKEEVVSF